MGVSIHLSNKNKLKINSSFFHFFFFLKTRTLIIQPDDEIKKKNNREVYFEKLVEYERVITEVYLIYYYI